MRKQCILLAYIDVCDDLHPLSLWLLAIWLYTLRAVSTIITVNFKLVVKFHTVPCLFEI